TFREEGFPVWTYDLAEEGWYGFPIMADGVLKISNHRHGIRVDPDVDRAVDADFIEESRAFLQRVLPSLDPETYDSGKSCLYTNSSDGHFILDRAPGYDRVFVAGAGSGHGFKFGPVMGRLAADLVEGGEVPQAFRLEGRVSGRVV
ncbi:MAG: FAD-dependent oxidoreductase, partial [Anaerolineae bacterium]